MSRRGVSLFVYVAALSACSCTNDMEVARAKAEAKAARAEAAEAKAVAEAVRAELAKAKADAEALKAETAKAEGKAGADAEVARARAAKAEAEWVSRWNGAAAGVTVASPFGGSGTVDFRWDRFDNFPHPTFKGGTAEAYRKFAALLVAFLQQGDNFDYLAANHLFTVELPNVKTTLAQLVAQLSQPGSFGAIDADTRKALQSFSERIQALLKKQEQGKS